MCLYSKDRLDKTMYMQIATHDMVCYKMVTAFQKKGESKITYCSPFCGDIIPEDVINGKSPYCAKEKDLHIGEKWMVEMGYVHTYKNRPRVVPTEYQQIYECIIPEGTVYYEGCTSAMKQEREGYASPTIIFKKRIKVKLGKGKHLGIPTCAINSSSSEHNTGRYFVTGKFAEVVPVIDKFLELDTKNISL